jgi:hypothetical protein
MVEQVRGVRAAGVTPPASGPGGVHRPPFQMRT